MKFANATLIKKNSDDGLFEVNENVQIGAQYVIDLDTLRVEEGYNIVFNKRWKREIVNVVDGGWFPTELLKIEEVFH